MVQNCTSDITFKLACACYNYGDGPPNYRNSGLEVKSYRHYDAATCGFDAPGAYEDLKVSYSTNTVHWSFTICERI